MGFAAACTARLGQALGAANIDDAKLTVKVALSSCSKYTCPEEDDQLQMLQCVCIFIIHGSRHKSIQYSQKVRHRSCK